MRASVRQIRANHFPYRLPRPVTNGQVHSAGSERQLEAELNQARIIHGVIHHGERRRNIEVRTLCVAARRSELRMIEQVEDLSAEIQPHSFAWHKVLDD